MMDTAAKAGIGVSVAIGVLAVSGVTFLAYRLLFSKKDLFTLKDPNVKVPLLLVDAYDVTHDTKKFIFKLPSSEHLLGIQTGQHVYMSAKIDGELVVRPYTPISSNKTRGQVDFIVKVYRPNEKFPNGGKMSQYLATLTPGVSTLDFKGPSGKIVYKGRGKFTISKRNALNFNVSKISLIAGGTGITPMYQMIEEILKDEKDKTEIKLLFANNTEQDIIMRDYLDDLARRYPSQFKVWYTITNADEKWAYSVGRINVNMIEMNSHRPGKDSVALVCGPNGFVFDTCIPALQSIGFPENRIYSF